MAKTLFELVQEYLNRRNLPKTFTYDRSTTTPPPVDETETTPVITPTAIATAMSSGGERDSGIEKFYRPPADRETLEKLYKGEYQDYEDYLEDQNKGIKGLTRGLFRFLPGGSSLLRDPMPSDPMSKSFSVQALGGDPYGYYDQMRAGNLTGQDPFGINTISAFGNYPAYADKTVRELEAKKAAGKTLSNFDEARLEFYGEVVKENKKRTGPDGDSYFFTDDDSDKIGDVDIVGGKKSIVSDKVTAPIIFGDNEGPDMGLGIGSFKPGSGFVDQGGLGEFGLGFSPAAAVRAAQQQAKDREIINRGGGDTIGTGGLTSINRKAGVDRGSSGAGDDRPVTSTTKPGELKTSTYDAELEDDRDTGGDGKGGGKIVCTMMNESYGFGSFRNKIWLRHSKGLAPEYQRGYHKIFLPLVKLSKKNYILKKVLEHIAVHRTIDIRQESRNKVHLLGRIYRKVLEPICYLVGKYGKN
tara:strand:+ start:4303 stop:5712 length:1410 start_codon:yes stop_codon:yes gene_type:complete